MTDPVSDEQGGVLLIIGWWDGRGGVQVLLREVMAKMRTRRPVTVITWHDGLRRPTRETDGAATIIRLPLLVPWEVEQRLVGMLGTTVCVLCALASGVITKRRWAAALAADLSPTGVIAVLLGRLLGRRAVPSAWLPGPAGQVGRLRRSPLAPLLRAVLRRADAFVVQTDEVADELRELPIAPERIEIIASGVSLERFREFSRDERLAAKATLGLGNVRVVLYCGRFDLRQKRLDLLLEAWTQAELRDWRLLLAGDGPDRAAVEDLATDLTPSVDLIPWRDDVGELYAAADIFVLPTSHEGMSRALLEGMASGLPGVVSRTPSHERIGLQGVALAPNEKDAWARELRALAADDVRRAALGAQARTWAAERAGVEEAVARYERVLFG